MSLETILNFIHGKLQLNYMFIYQNHIVYLGCTTLITIDPILISLTEFNLVLPTQMDHPIYYLERMIIDEEEPYHPESIFTAKKINTKTRMQSLSKQLFRLRHCIQKLPYSIAIQEPGGFLGVLEEGVSVYLYKSQLDSYRQMYIIVPFRVLYDSISKGRDDLEQDCHLIEQNVQNVLMKNHAVHQKQLKEMMSQDRIFSQIEEIESKCNLYQTHIREFTTLLEELQTYRVAKEYELYQIEKLSTKGMHIQQDMKRTHQKKKLKNELGRMDITRNGIVHMIQQLKEKYGILLLSMDRILYENNQMMDRIMKHFEELSI